MLIRAALKPFYFTLGWVFFSLGLLGVFLPVLPTTPFMLLALWMLARSSPRFHHWLYHHRLFGPPLQQWDRYRVIPPLAKVAAVSMMSLSLVYMLVFAGMPVYLNALVAVFMAYACWFILSKPSRPPE